MSDTDGKPGLGTAYGLQTSDEAESFYDAWSGLYDHELAEAGYAAPRRCAGALARFATDPAGPVAEFGCGTGLGGQALKAAGFDVIDGFDISEGMLEHARAKRVYRSLGIADLAESLEIEPDSYANAAAIGVVSTNYMPATVIDEMLKVVVSGGCLVFSLNDKSAADGTIAGRVCELTDTGAADLMLAEAGEHIPGTGLNAIVYVLRKR